VVRVRRTPEQRREEIVEAAARLFAERGVDATAVSDIVSAVHLSQGAFYWYFDSKDAVADAVVEHLSDRIVAGVVAIAGEQGTGAVEKLLRIRDALLSVAGEDSAVLAFFHRAGNEAFHDRVSRDSVRRIVPALHVVIEQGVSDGVFAIRHSEDAARFIAALVDVTDPFEAFAEPERIAHHAEALTEFALRGLGCSEATLARALGGLPEPETGR
jgi:AcrR family transcriptional regulator